MHHNDWPSNYVFDMVKNKSHNESNFLQRSISHTPFPMHVHEWTFGEHDMIMDYFE